MGRNRRRDLKSPKKFDICSAAKHHSNPGRMLRFGSPRRDSQEGTSNTTNIETDHSYAVQKQSESQKFDFLKKKISGDITVAHLNVEKLGVLKRRELGKNIKITRY